MQALAIGNDSNGLLHTLMLMPGHLNAEPSARLSSEIYDNLKFMNCMVTDM